MKILVTGSAGFIGFHLATRLLADGHDVAGMDNFNDYYSPALKHARDEVLQKNEKFKSNELDLCDDAGLKALFDRHPFDLVVHLAAQPGIRYSLINPQAYVRSNLEGFVNVIEQTRRHGIKRFFTVHGPWGRPGMDYWTFAVVSRLRQAVGFEPKTALADGMARFVSC